MTDKKEIFSLNKRYKLTFENFQEPRMGLNISEFFLTDTQSNKKFFFKPLWAIGWNGASVSWSENCNFFSLPIESPSDCFFIYDLVNDQFTSIRFSNCWILEGHCSNDKIEIEFRDDQIPERNENSKYPTKKFLKPENLQFKFSELHWIDINLISNFNEIIKGIIVHEFLPIDKGWRQFKGQLPQTTEILVCELREFAMYGDSQSIEWFNEIQAKTININYWVNASHYLGQQKRK